MAAFPQPALSISERIVAAKASASGLPPLLPPLDFRTEMLSLTQLYWAFNSSSDIDPAEESRMNVLISYCPFKYFILGSTIFPPIHVPLTANSCLSVIIKNFAWRSNLDTEFMSFGLTSIRLSGCTISSYNFVKDSPTEPELPILL